MALMIYSIYVWFFLLIGSLPNEAAPMAERRIDGINTIEGFTAEELVEDIFVKGVCKNIFNIEAQGTNGSFGYFEQGGEVIGLEKGIILSTGKITNAEGPNNDSGKSGKFNVPSRDPDLIQLAGSDTIMDVTALEFDFTPLDSNVTFRYVFASEEYCEYVDNVFNDVFGFFISGPGISGGFSDNAENVALIPGTRDFVTINSINHLRNADYYIGNEREEDANQCGINYAPSDLRNLIQFDGFTKVLTAQLSLIPCETYHLKLVVADVGDDSWDSAVFLESESFNIGGELELSSKSLINQDTIPEGCNYGSFVVSRLPDADDSAPITIGIRVSNNSSAVEGVDFEPLPDSVTIPAGRRSVDVPLFPIVDQEVEPLPELIELEFDFPCACISGKAELYLLDPPAITTGLTNQDICPGDRIELSTTTSGGVPGYSYLWSTGSLSEKTTVTVAEDRTVSLTVTDTCGRQFVDQIQLLTRPVPQARIPSTVRQTCLDDTVQVAIDFTGTPPFHFSYTQDGAFVNSFEGINEQRFLLTVAQEGIVELHDFGDAFCVGQTTGQFDLRYSRIQGIANASPTSCADLADGSIDTEVVGGTPPYQYNWDNGGGNVADPQGLSPGRYSCTVTDANGCTSTLSAEVKAPSPLRPITFDCREFLAEELSFRASGGTPPYLYSVDGGNYETADIFMNLVGGEQYILEIQDAQGCQLTQNFIMPVTRQKVVEVASSVKLKLGDNYIIQPQLNIPDALLASIQWSPSQGLSCDTCLMPEVTALQDQTYSLRVDDIFGCVGAAAITIKLDKQVDVFMPTAFSPNDDEQNDRFFPFANTDQVKEVNHFQVFSRWGTLLHRAENFPPNDPAYGWDGQLQGLRMDPGLYIYTAQFTLTNGVQVERNGTVLLMR